MVGRTVPEDLAAMPPGPELAAALASLDHRSVPNDDVITVLEAHSRQLAHEQARTFSAMNEVLHRLPTYVPGAILRGSGPAPYAADEVRAALAWSRRFADRETDLAFALVVGLPQVQQALLDGRIDRGKATAFAEHLIDLSEEQAEAICRQLLPAAPDLTPWQIADRIKKLILKLDPAYYERRYRKALRDQKVVAYLDADGAAVITGSGLPAEDAAAAVQRIDMLARATRRAGHPHTLDQIRVAVFLGLLDGSLHGLSREEIIAALLARAADPESETPESGTGVAVVPSESDIVAPAAARAADGEGPISDGSEPTAAEPGGAGPGGAGPGGAGPGAGSAVAHAGSMPPLGIEVRVALSTLLGRDELPGEIPGLGPVTATVARTVVARQRRAEWRWVVVDAEGRWMSDGITRRRPAGSFPTGVRGGVVELQIRRSRSPAFPRLALRSPSVDPGKRPTRIATVRTPPPRPPDPEVRQSHCRTGTARPQPPARRGSPRTARRSRSSPARPKRTWPPKWRT